MPINQAVRILRELKALQAQGLTLPYSPGFILRQEAQGRTVDLETGAIIVNGADQRFRPTAQGVSSV